mgnify:CR=1 FL=1
MAQMQRQALRIQTDIAFTADFLHRAGFSLRVRRKDGISAALPLQVEIIDDGPGINPEIAGGGYFAAGLRGKKMSHLLDQLRFFNRKQAWQKYLIEKCHLSKEHVTNAMQIGMLNLLCINPIGEVEEYGIPYLRSILEKDASKRDREMADFLDLLSETMVAHPG